jgi:SMI1 / KNR4 family (SUKH-1)
MDDLVKRIKQRLRWNRKSTDVMGRVFLARRPASKKSLLATEQRLGFKIPHTLRTLYLEVANGGFGPGYGVMGVDDGFMDDSGNTIADLYERYRRPDPEDPAWHWPEYLLPFCYWGCGVYSAVDYSKEPSPVYYTDASVKEAGEPMESIIRFHKPSIEDWLNDWLEGKDLWHEVWS